MSIKEEIIELNQTKQGIKVVFEEKGVDLQGKTFSDTPALIDAMSVGKGDEVETYAINVAKTAQENEKVILNYSADMLPFELQLTDETFKDATSNPTYAYNFLYIDKRRLCMGTSITTTYPLPVLLTRQSDGTYAYEKTLDTSSNFLSPQADFIPYGLFVRANTVYKMTAKNTIVSISSNNYIPGTLTYLNDGSLACSGGENPKLLKNVKGEWEVVASLSGFGTSPYYGYGLIGDKLLVIESSSAPLKTYTYDETGATTLVGSTTIESNVGGTYWRFFDNNTKVIVGTNYNSSDVQRSNLIVFDVTVLESGAYQFTRNSVLTENLASIVQQKVGNLLNVIKMDDNTFFVWGEGGLVYIELLQNMIVEHPTPFKSYTWTKAFFANSIDRVAAMQISPTESIVWFIDAPVTQNWVSDTATDSLFFADKSLTGLVKENNDGILTVSTVLDPNAVVPAYPDTSGLGVTVHPGTADSEQLVPYGTRSNLNNGNGLTFFGFMLDEPMTIGGIEMIARTDSGSSSSTDKYLKLFKWNSETNVYDFVACSTNTQQALNGTTARWEFATNQEISGAEYYGFAFSTDNTEAWSGITGSGIQTQSTDVSDDYHLMGSTSTNNPPSSDTFAFIPVFSFIQTGLIEGSVGISYGYFKSGEEYVKWTGMPSATLADVEGEKSTTMGLWLVEDSGTVKPVISISEPTNYSVRHNVSNSIYLSDTLDYFLPNPYGLDASVQYGYAGHAFEQPVLTANSTMGGDTPACAASSTEGSYYAWNAFDGNDTTYWGSSSADLPDWLCFYNPQALLVTSVDLTFTSEVYSAGMIQGSNDNEAWDDIGSFSDNTSQTLNVLCTTSSSYKYIRVYFTAVATPWGKVISMNINATVPFSAGSVTVNKGWQELDGVRYLMEQTTTKSFEDVIVGDKATTMGLWLTKDGNETDFAVSLNAPVNSASYKIQDVYLSNSLDYFVETPQSESVGV